MQQIYLRPHHLVCIGCFQGAGYNPQFVENLSKIHRALYDQPTVPLIQIVQGGDDVCRACPNYQEGSCIDEVTILPRDHAYAQLLTITIGERLAWQTVQERVAKRLTSAQFHRICGNCPWIKLCEPCLF